MTELENQVQWKRLMALLEPIHARAVGTARRLCRSSPDGDDLYQEAVLRAFRKLPTLRDPERFPSWFYAVLLSVHRSRCRRSFWRRFFPLEEISRRGEVPVGEDGERRLEAYRGAKRALCALASLSPGQREAVVLHEIEGYSVQEIADWQGVSESAVKSRLARGRDRLRRYYERRGWKLAHPPLGGETAPQEQAAPRACGPAPSFGPLAPVLSRREGRHE